MLFGQGITRLTIPSVNQLLKALYDFTAGSENEISCTADDLLRIAPKSKQPRVNGWILARFVLNYFSRWMGIGKTRFSSSIPILESDL